MKKLCNYLAAACLLVCGCVFAFETQARVCFATDENCGVGGNFPATPLVDPNDTACENEGYVSGAKCLDGYFKYNCPYKSSYVKCCAPKFRYEGCVYPLEVDTTAVGGVIKGQTIFGKCGTRYACKCPDEYGVTSDYAKQNNCQPGGGYCMLNDGTTDTINYKTCTCDRSVYTDEGGSCKNNQTLSATCKDDTGAAYSKCYCDRGEFPYAACMYGPSLGAKRCVDSNSGREYYSKCKTAEEACRTYDNEEDGDSLGTTVTSRKHTGFQHSSCTGLYNCRSKNKIYDPNTGETDYLTSSNCILGEQCPYPTNPGLYKCEFDKASWCAKNGYAQSSSSKLSDNSTCITPDGIQGKVINCPANDNVSLFYYRCKVTCDQRTLKEAASGGLNAESLGKTGHGNGGRFGAKKDINGVERPNAYWVYLSQPKNGFRKGYHLFLRGNVRLPDNGLAYNANNKNGDVWIRSDGNEQNPAYASINGISALYKLDPATYADCAEEYADMSEKPTLTIPLNGKYANDYTFSRDFHNINITLTRYDDAGNKQNWGENIFKVRRQNELDKTSGFGLPNVSTYVWSNIKMTVDDIVESSSVGNSDQGDGVTMGMMYDNSRAVIDLCQTVKIRFTGKINFDLPYAYKLSVSMANPELDSNSNGTIKVAMEATQLAFRTQEYAIIEFKDAIVNNGSFNTTSGTTNAGYSYAVTEYPDFDSDCDSRKEWNSDGVMVIDNSKVSAAHHFGCLYLVMKNNSTYNVQRFYSRATDDNYNKTNTGVNLINKGKQYCRAASIMGGSTLNIHDKHGISDIRKYLYITGGSTVNSNNPIRLMRGEKSNVCFGDSASKLNVNIFSGSYSKGEYQFDAGMTKYYSDQIKKYYIGEVQNVKKDKMIMYSAYHGACIPYILNDDPSYSSDQAKNASNPWWRLCTGQTIGYKYGNNKYENFNDKMVDEVSMITPAEFDVKIGSGYYNQIRSWYPRAKSTFNTGRCDFDKSGGITEFATLHLCSISGVNSETEPSYTDGGLDTFISGYNNGKCLNRQFLCSGCSYCDGKGDSAGTGYTDWTDVSGGLGGENIKW